MADTRHERFSQFFAETRQGLLRYVRGLTRSEAAAEDIVQDAYAATLAQGERLETPRAFLFVTARNLASNSRRHQRIAATESVADLDALGIADGARASPEDALIADEASALLRQAVERLPPQCRAAFALKVFHGYAYKDIAGRLGISPKTVEKHVARGLRDTHAYLRRRYQLPDRDGGGER
ncbi:sigma-70 family RNA polymerase sigma factor [Luteimonas sp. Y-2-2-4F]|nr:sigma-70 family RNA polymerase sigma factor [Luteimonas sp. Y-2-2-4F]MCD9033156.1 sigma-70 family RNA polymerase sigma factor [Luteimonas sp. Y-2-2-4F]